MQKIAVVPERIKVIKSRSPMISDTGFWDTNDWPKSPWRSFHSHLEYWT